MKTTFDGASYSAETTDKDHVEPCPFCGSDDVKLVNTWTASYWMACQDCGAEMHTGTAGDHDNRKHHLREAHRALDAWNCRA